jgi:hypothetical protein
MFDFIAVQNQISALDSLQEIKYISFDESNLGGNSSYFIRLSLDKKQDWANGIFHNSRYAIFSISPREGKIELLSKGAQMPKFRKSNIKNEANVANKIVTYCLNT